MSQLQSYSIFPNQSPQIITFDNILTNRIGLGRYQVEQFMVLSMIDFIDGVQEVFLGILLTILQNEWNLSTGQIEILGSVYYVGIMIGNYLCAFLSDHIGRKFILQCGSFLTFALLIITSQLQNYTSMCISRLIFGIIFGLSLPISQVVISEIVPLKQRGRFIVLLQLIYIVGILYLIGCCYIFLESFSKGDWRSLLLFNSIPAFFFFVGSMVWLKESPRFLLINKQVEEGIKMIGTIIQQNHKNLAVLLTEDEKLGLQNWLIQYEQVASYSQGKIRFFDLFMGGNLKTTISLWSLFIFYGFMYIGLSMLIPFIYSDTDNSFGPYILAYSSEIAAILITMLLIDSINQGRKRITVYAMTLLSITCIFVVCFRASIIVVALISMRFHFRVAWSCLNALPAESYPTQLRTMGVGSTQAIGKLIASMSPFIIFPLYNSGEYNPFYLGAAIFVICALIAWGHPIDLTRLPLDLQIEQQGESASTKSLSELKEIEIQNIKQ